MAAIELLLMYSCSFCTNQVEKQRDVTLLSFLLKFTYFKRADALINKSDAAYMHVTGINQQIIEQNQVI